MLKNALALLHPDVGVFCDLTRDAIKGDAFIERAPGFVNGGEGREQDILRAVIGWRDGWGEYTPRSCSQIVNYVSAHDNFTLWDKLVMCLGVNGDEAGAADLDGLWADVLEQNKLAAFMLHLPGQVVLPGRGGVWPHQAGGGQQLPLPAAAEYAVLGAGAPV